MLPKEKRQLRFKRFTKVFGDIEIVKETCKSTFFASFLS